MSSTTILLQLFSLCLVNKTEFAQLILYLDLIAYIKTVNITFYIIFSFLISDVIKVILWVFSGGTKSLRMKIMHLSTYRC